VNLFSQRVMAVWNIDDHTAACDALVKFIEFFGFLLNSCRDRVRWRHVTKRDLYWQDHVVSFFLAAPFTGASYVFYFHLLYSLEIAFLQLKSTSN
jgi:hypothetical protein